MFQCFSLFFDSTFNVCFIYCQYKIEFASLVFLSVNIVEIMLKSIVSMTIFSSYMIIAWLLLDNYGFFPLIYVFLNCLVDQIGRGLGQSAHCWNCNLEKRLNSFLRNLSSFFGRYWTWFFQPLQAFWRTHFCEGR